MIEECVAAGWNSVLFDASKLTYEDNMAQTREVVALAHRHGVAVEGELEAVKGVEDGVGSEDRRRRRGARQGAWPSSARPASTASPRPSAPRTASTRARRKINFQRVSEIVAAEPVPLVVHGGTGLSEETFRELIRRGAPKVNISTQLKITMADGFREYLTEKPTEYDPLKLLGAVKKKVVNQVIEFMRVFGSEGRA